MTHARSGLGQRKSLLGSGAPRAREADGLRRDLVTDLSALADNPHPACISLFKHIEPRVRAVEFLAVYTAQFVIGPCTTAVEPKILIKNLGNSILLATYCGDWRAASNSFFVSLTPLVGSKE